MLPAKNIKKQTIVGILVFLFVSLVSAQAQITVNSPLARDSLKACADYADETLLDRWDMNERTDLGWRIFNTVELPSSYLANITFLNGIFSATSSGTDPNVMILDSAYPGSALLGKVGTNFPIDADKYTRLVIRMYLGISQIQPWGQIMWSKNTMYGGLTTANSFFVHPGWYIYTIDIPSLGIASGSDPWNGLVDSLRLDPIIADSTAIQIDWIRLVEYDAACQRTITWSGNPCNVDIYLDNDNNPGNGNLGCLVKNVSGTSYSFLAGSLAPGSYYVIVVNTGGNPATGEYSSGYYEINDVPIIRLTDPSAEGSDTDFITVSTSDPWDMANAEDVEHTEMVQNASFTTLNYQDLAGNAYTNKSVYYGESQNGTGDPIVFFLHFLWRGKDYQIDTSRYHRLVFKMGIEGTPSVNDGSIARVIWRNRDETVENVSQDIIIRHLAGGWVMNKIVCDMNTLPLDTGPSQTGWNGWLDCFRIDPHEFTPTRAFFFDDIKLATDCKANTSFEIKWELSDSDSSPTVALYYDTNNTGYDGTLIVGGLTPGSGNGSYVWNTSGVTEGTYWVYATVDDGTNSNRCYTTGPVVVDHALIPEITLSESVLYFGAEMNGPKTDDEEVLLTNSGDGTLDWQAASNKSWLSVSPASGTGEAILTISVDHAGFGQGSYTGRVTITDQDAWNSPKFIDITMNVYRVGQDSVPFGFFDTPVEGSTVSGSVPVTGWALDDIQVDHVEIKRAPDPDDNPAAIGGDGLVYIGDAVFVKGARPDVEAYYPDYPRADRAGWGYLMLTYGLPRQGNGTFTLHAIAFDVSGHRVPLGTKTFTSDNDNRVKPFGTIDTPNQGGVASGSAYVNFGWALTPLPNEIPIDGSTIWVSIDGVFLGHPVYGQYREDIATNFSEYLNSDTGVGFYVIDTTTYENGVHNIGWLVTDNASNTDGIGSRFFEIQNIGGSSAAVSRINSIPYREDASGRLQIRARVLEKGRPELGLRVKEQGLSKTSGYGVRDTGYAEDQDHSQDSGLSAGYGVRDTRSASEEDQNPWVWADGYTPLEIEIEEMERVVLELEGSSQIIGWGSHALKSLPLGSTLDKENGRFYWIPGPGFLGKHVLHFAVSDGVSKGIPLSVIINIKPKSYALKN